MLRAILEQLQLWWLYQIRCKCKVANEISRALLSNLQAIKIRDPRIAMEDLRIRLTNNNFSSKCINNLRITLLELMDSPEIQDQVQAMEPLEQLTNIADPATNF
jgi:hypothetical protein